MSNVYNTEPPTKGKVTLKTTVGDIDVELWPKEAPKAVRNFVQLCLEGYYDGSIFHRIIKDFMAQTGDPTGGGTGGESVYGAPFRDEFHSRLRFSHRGLLACANANEPHTNGSQFFITLDKCEWLDKRNTIFGRVAGDTIYNVIKLNDYEVDEEDRPLEPPRILSCEVLWNPFDDIVPRTTAAEKAAEQQHKAAEAARVEKKGRKRNLTLLSFGDDAEAEEAQLAAARIKIKSAHEVLAGQGGLLAPEDTPEVEELERRSQEALARVRATLASKEAGGGGGGGAREGAAERVARERAERRGDGGDGDGVVATAEAAGARPGPGARGSSGGSDDSGESSSDGDGDEARPRGGGGGGGGGGARDAVAERREIIREKRSETLQKGIGRMRAPDAVADAELLKPWQVAREQYKNKKRAIGDRQKDTLARLAAFQGKLRGPEGGGGGGGGGAALPACCCSARELRHRASR